MMVMMMMTMMTMAMMTMTMMTMMIMTMTIVVMTMMMMAMVTMMMVMTIMMMVLVMMTMIRGIKRAVQKGGSASATVAIRRGAACTLFGSGWFYSDNRYCSRRYGSPVFAITAVRGDRTVGHAAHAVATSCSYSSYNSGNLFIIKLIQKPMKLILQQELPCSHVQVAHPCSYPSYSSASIPLIQPRSTFLLIQLTQKQIPADTAADATVPFFLDDTADTIVFQGPAHTTVATLAITEFHFMP